MENLKASKVSMAPVAPLSTASLRARQAHYPTSLLASKSGFMAAMSSETRSMIASTMYGNLGKLKAQMDSIEEIVNKELCQQLALRAANWRKLYSPFVKRRASSEGGARGSAQGGTTTAVRQEGTKTSQPGRRMMSCIEAQAEHASWTELDEIF